MDTSPDVIEDYTGKYETMVAARDGDLQEMAAQYSDVEDVTLSIDGLQPEKGHETLYVVRELRKGRIWFAEAPRARSQKGGLAPSHAAILLGGSTTGSSGCSQWAWSSQALMKSSHRPDFAMARR